MPLYILFAPYSISYIPRGYGFFRFASISLKKITEFHVEYMSVEECIYSVKSKGPFPHSLSNKWLEFSSMVPI